MNIIEQHILDLSKTSLLQKEITRYADFLILSKNVVVSSIDYTDSRLLIENDILKTEGNLLKIKNYTFIAIAFLEHYKSFFSYAYSPAFEESIAFWTKIKNDFTDSRYTNDYTVLELEILKIIIYETNKEYDFNFNSYINQLSEDKDSEYFYDFIDSYSVALQCISIDIETAYKNSVKLLELTKSDAQYNLNEGTVLSGIQQKCFADEDFGIRFFDFSINKKNPEKNDIIISAAVTGLYQKIGQAFYENYLKDMLENKINVFEIINGLSNIDNIQQNDFDLFISLFNKHKANSDLHLVIAKLFFAVLKADNFNDASEYKDKCFEGLNEILINESASFFILHKTTSLQGND